MYREGLRERGVLGNLVVPEKASLESNCTCYRLYEYIEKTEMRYAYLIELTGFCRLFLKMWCWLKQPDNLRVFVVILLAESDCCLDRQG